MLDEGIRTLTELGLSQSPLPLGYASTLGHFLKVVIAIRIFMLALPHAALLETAGSSRTGTDHRGQAFR